MKIKTLKADGLHQNDNQATAGLKLKSSVKAGGLFANHNQAAAGLKHNQTAAAY